jgi:DNA end-binding protein Ku
VPAHGRFISAWYLLRRRTAMAAIWKGSINFGLVHIPVSVHSAAAPRELSFRMLDGRTMDPIRYIRVNEGSGKEVEWDDIVKGYEYEKDKFVLVSEDDFKRAEIEANQSIEIDDFVDREKISPLYFEKPYYLLPEKGGEKGYVLLREVLNKTQKIAIARVVFRSKEHLAAVLPEGPALVLNTLRYAEELKAIDTFQFPANTLEKAKVNAKELRMAERLVKEMIARWEPQKYEDRFAKKMLEIVEEKIEGEPSRPLPKKRTAKGKEGKVIDMAELLRKSLEERGKQSSKKAPARKRA